MSIEPTNIKILHEFTVTIDRETDETTTETQNGQPVTITRKVKKPVATKMALRDLTRKERRAADLFQASQTAHYVKDHKLLLASELTNRLINTTGGVLTEKEKDRVEQLRARHVSLELDISRENEPEKRKGLQNEQATIRTELISLNAINESVYSQTAEAKAQADLNNWLIFRLIMIDRGGKWVPYFEGDGNTETEVFRKREEFMWDLEEKNDEFYAKAMQPMVTYTYWFSNGVNTPEGFAAMEAELKVQKDAREAEAAAKVAAAAAATAAATPHVAPQATPHVEPVPTAA